MLENFDPAAYKVYEMSPLKSEHERVVEPSDNNSMLGRSLSEQEAVDLIAQMKAKAKVAPATELTPENWIAQFGENGTVETPIGIVKMGANQLQKLYSLKRTKYFGMMHPTLNSPDVIIEKNAPVKEAERDSKYLFVKTFIKSDGSRLVHFESVTVQRDGMEISISSHEAEAEDIKKDMQKEKILHISEKLSPGSEWSLTEAPSETEGPDLVPSSDNVSSDGKVNTLSSENQIEMTEAEAEEDILCRPVTDEATLERLNSEPTVKVYRAMQLIDGGLLPPMSAKVDGEFRESTEIGVWEESEERPELADDKGRFKLDKGNGKSIKAAYNPYFHTSRIPINDQFSSAWSRPELVTVEVEVPASELTSGYKAEKAKNSVGEKSWKSGPIGRILSKLGQARKVILSRWSRVVRIVPVEEVAEAYAQRLNAHGIEVPFNTVPPALREALVARGVKIGAPERGNAGKASMPAFEEWINEQERQRMGDGYGAYSDAEVSYANDPISKVMGKNRFSKKRQAEFAARERQRMVARVQELAQRMHLDNVEIITDSSQLEGKRATAKGYFNKRTGKITIVIPNNVSTIDVEQTLLHEAVAHYGLRQLFGAQFDTFLDNVYESADPEIRRKIAEMAARNGWNFRTATEEYLAGLAEDTNFSEAQSYTGWWSRIKGLFLSMLEKIGFAGFRDATGVVLTDNELRYLLWRSYENLAEPGRYRSILGEAADVAKQSELKVGNYAEQGIEAEYAAEPGEVERIIEEEEFFRPGDFSPRDREMARTYYENMVRRGSWHIKEALQDSMLGLKALYESIVGKGTRIIFVAIELEKDLKLGGKNDCQQYPNCTWQRSRECDFTNHP